MGMQQLLLAWPRMQYGNNEYTHEEALVTILVSGEAGNGQALRMVKGVLE